MTLNDQQLEWCDSHSWNFSDLKALFLNCTLKPTPQLSHTEGLINISKAIMELDSHKFYLDPGLDLSRQR